MNAKKVLIILSMLGLFSGSIAAEEAYHVVKIWPEAPQGWHFYQPFGVAVDGSGNVYVGDRGNFRVKKFDSEGRFITQWGSPGQGDGQFNTIYDVKVGSSGIVYVLDIDDPADNHSRIQKFTPYGQFVGTLERRTPDVETSMLAVALAVDDKGNVFVLAVDFIKKENRIRRAAIEKYSPDGEFIAQWGTDAGSGDGQLQLPAAIAIDAKGNVYVADNGNHRVQKFDSNGNFITKWGAQGDGDGLFVRPCGIAVDEEGDVYTLHISGIQKFTPEGKFLARWKTKDPKPSKIAVDSQSNVYVVCMRSHTVLKFDNAGKAISEWGNAGSEDGRLKSPGSIALDSSGNAFVADVGNNRIQRFESEGNFLSNWGGEAIWIGAVGLVTDASGNLYVACFGSNEVQKYNTDGKLISRWGSKGSGDGQFNFPSAIAVGPLGNVYVADVDNNRIQKFSSDGTFLMKWGTDGPEDGQFNGPFFIAVDGSGNVWVGDQLSGGTHRIQKFDSDGKFLTKWTKRRITTPLRNNLYAPMAVDSSGNSHYPLEGRIKKYDANGDLINGYGQEEFIEGEFGAARGMCIDEAGYLYLTGSADPCGVHISTGSIRKFDGDGKLVNAWIGENTEGKESLPNGPITVDGTGNIYVSHLLGTSIWKMSSDGKPVSKFQIEPPSTKGRFNYLRGVAVDNSGKVYAVESVDVDWGYGIPSIKKFNSNGEFNTMWGVPEEAEGKFKYPGFIAVDGSGNAYVTDYSSHCIHKLDAQGKYIKSWGSKGTGDGQFDTPEGIAVDKSGYVLVCDRQNSRIQKFDSNGRFLAKWGKEGSGEGEFHFPAAVAIGKEGNVFVADSDNHRVQKFTAEGKFLTEWGEFGEAPGQFNVPLGIAVDGSGNVFVSDSHNHRIQKFAPVRSH
ncbi:MAG: NHL repeat-containing protein [Sedimentisphaerales bacterium]